MDTFPSDAWAHDPIVAAARIATILQERGEEHHRLLNTCQQLATIGGQARHW